VDKRIRGRFLRGMGASFYGQVVVVIVQLAGVPILLHQWGAQLYGEWLVLFAIPAYLSLTDLGFSLSVANDMTSRVAREDRVGALTVFQSLASLVFPLAGCGLAVVGILAATLPIGEWTQFVVLDSSSVTLILWFLGTEVLIRLTEGVSHAGFRATGDYALHVTINYSTILLQHTSMWLVASLGYGPIAAAAVFLVVRALSTPTVAIVLVRRHPWLHFGFRHAKRTVLRDLLAPAFANLGLPLAQAINVQGMVILIGSILGPIAVVTFSTLRTLTRLCLQLVQAVSHAAEPELAAAFGRNDEPLVRTLYQHVLRGGLWLSMAAGAFLVVTGNWILKAWTGGRVMMHADLFYWLLASAVASGLWYGSLILLKAANRHLGAAVVYIVSSATAIVLASVLLAATHNVAMAGLSLLLMDGIMAAVMLRSAAELCHWSALSSLAAALNPKPLLRLLTAGTHAY
jgi:O-antigen/teichoic acid export membrane protein